MKKSRVFFCNHEEENFATSRGIKKNAFFLEGVMRIPRAARFRTKGWGTVGLLLVGLGGMPYLCSE